MVIEQPVRAALDPKGLQVVEIAIDGGYHPAVIVARAGRPLRLSFRREDDDVCSERVVFSEPRLDRRLSPTGLTIIDLPARPPGAVRFTCGMGRYRGSIEFVDMRSPASVGQLRSRMDLLKVPLRKALVRWCWSLPVVLVVGVLAFDLTAAIVLSGAALVAWVAGCLWAFRGSVARLDPGVHEGRGGLDNETASDGVDLSGPSSVAHGHRAGLSNEPDDRARNGKRDERKP